MEAAPHWLVLGSVFAIAFTMGAIVHKTNFCTMGAVSDWVVMGDTGRLRAWLLAMAVAMIGVGVLEYSGARIGTDTFPPYRTPTFAWARYVLGGFAFGVGMTLASGCGNKTLVRVGSGNLKSLVVVVIVSIVAYAMLWTGFYATAFDSWLAPLAIDLKAWGFATQSVADLVGLRGAAASLAAIALGAVLLAITLASRSFRTNVDNVLGGVAVGLAVVAGWLVTTGAMGEAWKEYAMMAANPPARVAPQSLTFISPMGDIVRFLASPTHPEYINFGIAAMAGVIAGSAAWSLLKGSFRVEWFADGRDAARHVVGGVLMGVGGVLAMGCTIGQAVTGISTLALGSFLTFATIVAGCAMTIHLLTRSAD